MQKSALMDLYGWGKINGEGKKAWQKQKRRQKDLYFRGAENNKITLPTIV